MAFPRTFANLSSATGQMLDDNFDALTANNGSSQIGFLQSGTGAAPRTAESKMQEIVSVTDFGAVGDGVTSDQTAFDNATALGRPVFVPYTSSFYVVTTLSAAQISLLWGSGLVKVAGVEQPINSAPPAQSTTSPTLGVVQPSQTPTNNVTNGSVGLGAAYVITTRSGGYGQYGNVLQQYTVSAATPSGQFDAANTAWATHKNLTGGQLFGGWFGANSPSSINGGTYSSGAAIAAEYNVGNRWTDFGLQTDIGGTRYTVGLQIVPDVIPTSDTSQASVTISVASPAVVTWVGHGLTANTPVVFSGAGLPTGISAGTVYYVIASGLGADVFEISTSIGGAAVNTTGSFTAPCYAIPSYPGSFATVLSHSNNIHKWWVGNLLRADTIMPGGHANLAHGGSTASINNPLSYATIDGYWNKGIDMSSGIFTGNTFASNGFFIDPIGGIRVAYAGIGVTNSATSGVGINVQNALSTTTGQYGGYFAPTVSTAATSIGSGITTAPATTAAAFTLNRMAGVYAANGVKGAGSTINVCSGFFAADQNVGTANYGYQTAQTTGYGFYNSGNANNNLGTGQTTLGSVVATGTAGIGYATGAGGTVTQITSRTTGVTLNKTSGQITLVSAAGTTAWQTFTVTNSTVVTTDTIIVNQASGVDLNMIHVTAVGAGSFNISFATTGGVTVEQPVFNFNVIKGVAA